MLTDLGRPRILFILGLVLLILLFYISVSGIFLRLLYPKRYETYIESYSERYKLDPSIVYSIIKVESSFDPNAESVKGARGLMQLMPDTAGWAASELSIKGYDPDMLYDPKINIMMGCWYFSKLLKEFGDMTIALASYNAGSGRVRRWLEEDVWSGKAENIDEIPFSETRDYINKVLSTRKWYIRLYEEK